MRFLRYLKAHKLAVVLIFVLLMGQAFCDLALPGITSQIVDVGIQQDGVEHAAVEEMTPATYEKLSILLPDSDQELLLKSYDKDEDSYRLNTYGKQHQSELDQVLAVPLATIHKQGATTTLDWDQLMTAYERGSVAREDLLALQEQVAKSGTGMTPQSQEVLAAARAEYQAVGYDLSGIQMGYLVRTGALMLLIAAVGMVIAIGVSFIAARTAARIGFELRQKLFGRVVAFTEDEISKFSAASLITRGTNDIQLIQNSTTMLLRMAMMAPIMAFGGIVMVMVTSPSLGLVVLGAILCVFALLAIIYRLALPRFKIMQKLIDGVNLVAREMLSGLPVVRAFDREAHEEARFEVASQKLMDTQLFTNRVMTFMMPVMMLIMNLTSIAIIWFGGLSVEAGTLQTGDLIAFITYAMVIIMSFLMLGMVAIMLPRADVAARRVDEVLATELSVQDPTDPQELSVEDLPDGAAIEFSSVSFRYDESEDCVLESISFKVEPGETLAIVGSTGSGKTTILKLLERFYDVTEGAITVDGVDIRQLKQQELRAQFGYVPQKAFLFQGTVESNVGYGEDRLALDRIEKALEVAQATSFVAEREGGLESEIAQGGTNVSGGQRQRLAIARAVAVHPRAYLFDDSFSALDYKTDAALRQALRTEARGATQIIVAQRIATVMDADKILVLQDGRVAGLGTHEALMSECEEYQLIARSQLSEAELAQGKPRGLEELTPAGSAVSPTTRTRENHDPQDELAPKGGERS